MYLLSFVYQNARLNGTGQFSPNTGGGSIPKWTLLGANERTLELLRLIAASCNSPQHLERIPFKFKSLCGDQERHLLAKHVRVLHPATDGRWERSSGVAGGVEIHMRGKIEKLTKIRQRDLLSESVLRNPLAKSRPGRDFLLGYGDEFLAHSGDDDFDFTDPWFRTRRYRSLFSSTALLTDPVAFLSLLFYRGRTNKRHVPLHALTRICRLMNQCFGLDVHHWLEAPAEAEQAWEALPTELHKPLIVALDAVRHTLDAFPKMQKPLNLPGVILLHSPSNYCEDALLSAWLKFMDELFPNMQFFMTIPTTAGELVPEELLGKELPVPAPPKEKASRSPENSKTDVLLIDVDSRLPNLALMKLSRYFKQRGRKVALVRGAGLNGSAREVYASCIFNSSSSAKKVQLLRSAYGDALNLGGSGIDPQARLPAEIEALPPDYDLYPELGDRAIGFLSRGCPFNCPFCIVPLKEGPPRQVSDLQTLLDEGRRDKLILLDDNLLSLPQADRLLEEMITRKIMVNFTQTLDLRFVDPDIAKLLRRVNCRNTRFTRSNYHFSLNDSRNLDRVRKKYELFGFTFRDNVEFVCMYGFNTTLAEDVERFRFLRTLPGAYVFTQKYQPVPGGPLPDIDRFFEGDADRLILELIKIEFTQNMKSMERYYRWVSKEYAKTFGGLHMPLVDTIFRYNRRHLKGRYIATMAGLKK